jgi:SAM-dependent methyltransferase
MESYAYLPQTALEQLVGASSWLISLASPERAFYPSLIELAAVRSGDRVLDLGCGNGDFLAAVASSEAGAVLYGLDPDSDALELASRRIFGTVHPVELHLGVAERLPFEDDEFDVLTVSLVFSRLNRRQQDAALAECLRVLRPGGRLLLSEWEGSEALLGQALELPLRAVRDALGMSARTPRLADQAAVAGFHPPEVVERFQTLAGPILLLEAFVPSHRRIPTKARG